MSKCDDAAEHFSDIDQCCDARINRRMTHIFSHILTVDRHTSSKARVFAPFGVQQVLILGTDQSIIEALAQALRWYGCVLAGWSWDVMVLFIRSGDSANSTVGARAQSPT
jgi:hypothetical protein